MRKEAVTLESLSIAQAVKASGGKVILQVESVVEGGSIDPRLVKIPGIYVDAIVISEPENHMQTFGESFQSGLLRRHPCSGGQSETDGIGGSQDHQPPRGT